MSVEADVRYGDGATVPRVPGEPGVWALILGEMVVFAILFATYLFYRGREPGTFASAQRALSPAVGVVMTLLLLTASLLVVIGVRAVGNGDTSTAPRAFLAAAGLGAGFAGLKFFDYHERVVHGETSSTNHFFQYYFILTGIHLFHLVIGVGVLGVLARLSAKQPVSAHQFAFVEGAACYWHMVDMLWIVLFPLLYFLR